MRRVMYNVNGTLTPSYNKALASGQANNVVLEKIIEPYERLTFPTSQPRPKAVKPR